MCTTTVSQIGSVLRPISLFTTLRFVKWYHLLSIRRGRFSRKWPWVRPFHLRFFDPLNPPLVPPLATATSQQAKAIGRSSLRSFGSSMAPPLVSTANTGQQEMAMPAYLHIFNSRMVPPLASTAKMWNSPWVRPFELRSFSITMVTCS